MANKHTEEETQPLAAPVRRVAEAYSTNERQNNMKKYSFWVFAFVALLLLTASNHNDDRRKKRAKKLRNKAETLPEAMVQQFQNANTKINLNEKYAQLNDAHAMYDDSEDSPLMNDMMDDQDELDAELGRVQNELAIAEEDEIESNYSILTSAVQTVEESVKYYLGGVFGYGDEDDEEDDDSVMSESSADIKLTEEQLDVIAEKISARLALDVKTEFRSKADAMAEEKIIEIDKVVFEDKDANMNVREIEMDVKEAGDIAVVDLKEEIEDAANRVKDEIPDKMKKIRNDVVKEMTGKRLDEIMEKKRERKEVRLQKKAAMMKKFQELQAKGKEDAAKSGTNLQKDLRYEDHGSPEGGQNLMKKSGTLMDRKYPLKAPRERKYPLKSAAQRDRTNHNDDRKYPMKKNVSDGSDESKPSVGKSPVTKSGSPDDEASGSENSEDANENIDDASGNIEDASGNIKNASEDSEDASKHSEHASEGSEDASKNSEDASVDSEDRSADKEMTKQRSFKNKLSRSEDDEEE